ncbi:MAG: tetratricopeptide repeat protein [bacterium]|nr:tetratricopeptide repeat protein [bacterium]
MSSCESEEVQEATELNATAKSLLKTDLSQAKVYAFSALEVANNKADRFESYFILGYIENELGNLGTSISHYMEAIELYPDEQKSVSIRKNLGQIFQKLGNYDLAIYHFLQGFEHTRNEKRVEFMLYLGKAYMWNEDFHTAGEYFHLAITEAKENSYLKLLASSYNLEGLRNKKAGDLDKAREYYQLVVDLKDAPSYEMRAGIAYHNLGDSYLIEGDLNSAKEYFKSALKLRERKSAKYITNMDLGECYLKLGEYSEAELYLNEAKELYGSFTADPDDMKLFQHLMILSQVKGNTDKALEYSNKFNSEMSSYYETRDKHLQATSIAAVKSFANLYEEGLSNKKVIKKTVYSIWAIAAGGVLSLVLMVMLWLRFVKRRSKMQYELMELIEGL